MTATPFDVVVVSDFSGSHDRRFEIMTLLFLASWLEFAGRSRDLPLHLACIGNAPESVRVMADRCGAEITSHRPMLSGGFANKLRGYEVNRQTDHMLLLDSDMLVLSEFHDLPERLGRDCIAAAPANGPCIVPRETWKRVHEMLGVPYPQIWVDPLNFELDTFQCVKYRDRSGPEYYKDHEHFPPFYNGGIVWSPWECDLGAVWQDHLVRIANLEPEIAVSRGEVSNQPALATSISYLETQGVGFRRLPDEYHVRWQHIATGKVSSRKTRLYHTIGFGRWSGNIPNKTAEQEIDIYLSNSLRLTRMLRSHRRLLTRLLHRLTRYPRIRDCHRVHALMRALYEKHVREWKP